MNNEPRTDAPHPDGACRAERRTAAPAPRPGTGHPDGPGQGGPVQGGPAQGRPSRPTGVARLLRRSFCTPVRGHAFAPRPGDVTGPQPGQLARLVREPDNPADPYAVGIWIADARGRWRIGYLDRAVAARLAPRLDAGAALAARVEGWVEEPDGRWQRPVVRVLPDAAERGGVGGHGAVPSRLPRSPGVTRRRIVER